MCRVCGNSALTLPPWVGATARRQRGYWVSRVGGCFAVESSTEAPGRRNRRPGGSGIYGRTDAENQNDEGRMRQSVLGHSFVFVISSFDFALWLLDHLTGVCPTAMRRGRRSRRARRWPPGSALPWRCCWARDGSPGCGRRFREPIKSDSPEVGPLAPATNRPRRRWADCSSSPALVASVLLFGDLGNGYLAAALLVAVGLTAGGHRRRSGQAFAAPPRAFPPATNLPRQLVVARRWRCLLYRATGGRAGRTAAARAAGGQRRFRSGLWFIPLAVVVIVGASNAVNLTDGLDGLAGGCLIAATAAMTGLVYAAGHAELGRLSRRAAHSARRRNDRPGRRHDRRRAGVPLVQLPSGTGIHGQHRGTAAGRPVGRAGRWSPGKNCCWWSWPACSSSRP